MTRITLILLISILSTFGRETFNPYKTTEEVPQNVEDLWDDYDPRKELLEIELIKEWQTKDVITRYVTFKVGTFKGADSRIAAYYSFPRNSKKNAAFVWSHGGGQRAEKNRGIYFAKQGFATLDINWLGRPLKEGIEKNTDWGNVDPTQGPRFYAKSLRKGWKHNMQSDDHTIDSVASPRNSNWFLLAVAARRAITFLEQQDEVDPNKIGFSGYSMGGMITSLVAMDSRLQAVVPMVGGTGFKYVDFLGGIEGSSIKPHFKHLDLYKKTMDPEGYWPLVKCPVLFITSSNDFHSTFERIYQSMNLLNHSNWRVSSNIHQNHGPGNEQWVLLNLWFEKYLQGKKINIPLTPLTDLSVNGSVATFSVTPKHKENLVSTDIYYSYDPNSRTRFWIHAEAKGNKLKQFVDIPIHKDLPLYVFASCRYRLKESVQLERGNASLFVINSDEKWLIPEKVNLKNLKVISKEIEIFEDFKNGIRNWSSRDNFSIKTYKFQSPLAKFSENKNLCLLIDPKNKDLLVTLRLESKFLSRENNIGDFSYSQKVQGDVPVEIIVPKEAFKASSDRKLEWSKVATFQISMIEEQTKQRIDLTSSGKNGYLKSIKFIDSINN
ncbi:MAG: hypothetical protein EVB09_10475 [Verrucomicrobiaceae bacterium]|nr:MAG: hypothetical protein EVB09_10475 [Verrucomicrobiaceae bacterium]